ncbi:MAG TPA: hypothetical protein VGK40_09160 [Verrucomicrobiae bacterium]
MPLIAPMLLRAKCDAAVFWRMFTVALLLCTATVIGLAAPVNDSFTNRISVTGSNITITGSNVGATAEPGEPLHDGYSAFNSVWWSWTAPGDGCVFLRTNGSNFQMRVAVYTGSEITALTPILDRNVNFLNLYQFGFYRFAATAGTTYQIAVDTQSRTIPRCRP